jgi:hypothetical protein
LEIGRKAHLKRNFGVFLRHGETQNANFEFKSQILNSNFNRKSQTAAINFASEPALFRDRNSEHQVTCTQDAQQISRRQEGLFQGQRVSTVESEGGRNLGLVWRMIAIDLGSHCWHGLHQICKPQGAWRA